MFKGTFKNALRTVARQIETKLKLAGKAKPYHLWAALTKRKAAPVAATRQSVRHALFMHAFKEITAKFSGEARAQRRTIARAAAKRHWRTQYDRVAA